MLYSVDAQAPVTRLPHVKEFNAWQSKISDTEFQAVVGRLNDLIDGDEVHTAGWMPGSDWTGTVFEPLYHACGQNVEASGLFFGLIVFHVMMERDDWWGFGRYEKDGLPIRSMTYFRLKRQP